MKINVTIEIDDDDLKRILGFKEKETEVKDERIKSSEASEFARWFDDGCVYWTDNPEYNLLFLRSREEYVNAKLKMKGYLFLNDVYDALGYHRTRIGQEVGWIYDEKNPIGDNYVDFGIYKEANIDFVNGHETKCLLDFNVDGEILDRI